MKKRSFELEKVHVDLDIDEQIPLQKTGWRIQSIGLCIVLVLVICAAFGVYGDGIASYKVIHQNKVRLEFQRFFRQEANLNLKIVCSTAEDMIVAFPSDYLDHFEIESIVPPPSSTYFQKEMVNYLFKGNDNVKVTFYMIPQDIGTINGIVKVNGESFAVNQFIFP